MSPQPQLGRSLCPLPDHYLHLQTVQSQQDRFAAAQWVSGRSSVLQSSFPGPTSSPVQAFPADAPQPLLPARYVVPQYSISSGWSPPAGPLSLWLFVPESMAGERSRAAFVSCVRSRPKPMPSGLGLQLKAQAQAINSLWRQVRTAWPWGGHWLKDSLGYHSQPIDYLEKLHEIRKSVVTEGKVQGGGGSLHIWDIMELYGC